MISRRTARLIGEYYEHRFIGSVFSGGSLKYTVDQDALYNFLFDNDYPSGFCNRAFDQMCKYPTHVTKLIMRLHTGETLIDATKNWAQEQRKELGQWYLRNLAEDILNDYNTLPAYDQSDFVKTRDELLRSLEVDGYIYRDNHLLAPESDVLDTAEEQGVLDGLYTSLALDNISVFRSKLQLSERHYIDGLWSDSVANSRLVLEGVLQEVASTHSKRVKGATLPQDTYSKPFQVRQYLENEGLLETKEREVIQYTYGLLSNVGSHPYMAEKDQARLLRHMALTLSQFVLLRLEGALKQKN